MIYDEIKSERAEQVQMFSAADDDRWSPGEWAALVARYATRSINGDLHQIDPAWLRADMVKAAAVAVACIEAIDRKAGK